MVLLVMDEGGVVMVVVVVMTVVIIVASILMVLVMSTMITTNLVTGPLLSGEAPMPHLGKIMSSIQVPHPIIRYPRLGTLPSHGSQSISALTRSVIDMYDHIAQAMEVERVVFLRDLDHPG